VSTRRSLLLVLLFRLDQLPWCLPSLLPSKPTSGLLALDYRLDSEYRDLYDVLAWSGKLNNTIVQD
jgi:hypothetical protein